MPLYEYECEACGRRFERIQRFSDPPVTVCPHCGGVVHKLMSSPAIQFKGSGWYVTDYASPAEKDKKDKDKKEKDREGDKAEKKPSGDTTAPAESKETVSKVASSKEGSSGDTKAKDPGTKA